MQKYRRAQQGKRASQDESNKPKITSEEYKRQQRERKRAAAHASSVNSVAVERRDVSPQSSTSTQTVSPGTVQHQTGKDGHQVPVVPLETEQPVNVVATSRPETAVGVAGFTQDWLYGTTQSQTAMYYQMRATGQLDTVDAHSLFVLPQEGQQVAQVSPFHLSHPCRHRCDNTQVSGRHVRPNHLRLSQGTRATDVVRGHVACAIVGRPVPD
jgi:hypothetical protein